MKYSISLISILLIFVTTSYADDFKKNREISRTFLTTEETEIQINNKYGNIQIINWEKDSVMIQVEISVTGSKLSKVNKTFDYIDVDFTSDPYYVIANTIFKNERNRFWTDVSDITNSIFKGGNNTQINYTVYMSKNSALKIMNKFGNIYLSNRKAITEIKLSNGDLKANDISGYLQMDFSYGSANIKKATNAQIKINYGDIRIKSIQTLDLDSRSSTFDCDEINILNIISKRDKLFIGDINEIDGRYSFSEVEIDYLVRNIRLDTNFGDLTIDKIDNKFKKLDLNSSNTDITLIFNQLSAYKIDLSYTKRSTVDLPRDYKNINTEYYGKNDENTRMKAISGNSSDPSKLYITLKSGSLNIINK